MYLVLDKGLKVCGTLRLDGRGCRFYNDLITTQIADDSGKLWNQTLQMSVPYGYPESDMMAEGYHLLHQGSDGQWYCFRINSWADVLLPSGVHVKQIQAVNLSIWDLAHTTVTAGTLTNATSQQAFSYCLQRSGWTIGLNTYSGGTKTEEFQLGSTAQSILQQLNADYGVEIRAYVKVYNGQVIGKYIDIVDHLGDDSGERIEYSRNMTGITRQGGDDTLYTMLHVYGGTSSGENAPVSIAPVNGGKDFITDEDANDLYNGASDKYLEGYVQNTNILNPSGLLAWGREQLAYYNHPKYIYTVDVANLNASLGDGVRVVDFEMSPMLTISARVIQRTESEAQPDAGQVVLGEFIELKAVTPNDIERLTNMASAANRAAREAQAPNFVIFTPDGFDFHSTLEQKRLIVRAYQGKQEVTYTLDPSQFVWQKINADGSHDATWEADHVGAGNVITVDVSVAGCTIRCAFNSSGTSISRPVYFQTGLDALVDKLARARNDRTTSILFVTDSHIASGGFSNPTITIRGIDHLRNVAYLTQKAPIDLVVHGGDLTDGDAPKNQVLDDQLEAAGNLARQCNAPIFFLNGNHDDASLYAQSHDGNRFEDVILPDERYNLLKAFIGKDFKMHDGFENRLYGLMDFPDKKLRVICLNVFENPYTQNSDGTNKYVTQHTAAVMQDQLDWLANVALQVPDDSYSVLLFSHTRYAQSLDANYKNINFNLVRGLINAFKNGTSFSGSGTVSDYAATVSVDFSGRPHTVIADIHGHGHYDGKWTENGVTLIQTLDCLARNDYPGKMPDRPFPSLQEDAWDVYTIDPGIRKVYVTRFGAGSDREFSY
ncbi:phage tail spike protein [Sporolactobacillus terrae]|uniref:phage tail spike protein n=1 Tax=Sporolactobacillus terrae TaxID=269673 RepID=UPI00048DEAD3|nr:phage tail spike protein [Sporolactobacillus terrae]